jgi:hypothetical protein
VAGWIEVLPFGADHREVEFGVDDLFAMLLGSDDHRAVGTDDHQAAAGPAVARLEHLIKHGKVVGNLVARQDRPALITKTRPSFAANLLMSCDVDGEPGQVAM